MLHTGFSLVPESGGYFLLVAHGLLTVVASLVSEHGLQVHGASVVVAQGLSCHEAREIFPDQGSKRCP